MPLTYKFLSRKMLPEIHKTFLEAFKDYAMDASEVTEDSKYKRCVKNGIDWEASAGVFHDGRMVGLSLTGIDDWKGGRYAYDIVTGIVKEHRGQGLAREMFDFMLPKLKEKGVNKFSLEVLQVNEAAVKAYTRTGFHITREFDCFDLKLNLASFPEISPEPVQLERIPQDQIDRFADFMDWEPSWENSMNSIKRIPDDVYVFAGKFEDQYAGSIAFYPAMNWIVNIAVKKNFRRQGIGSSMLKQMLNLVELPKETVRLINVESSDTGMIKFLGKAGFELLIKQYEMEMEI